ncbi:MAG: alpha/beta hydrolase [Dehalococcoidia bacterium]
MPRTVLYVGLALVIAVALLFVGIRSGVIERSFIYFPDRDLIADPAYVGLPFEEVSFAASDGVQLHGWFVPGEKEVTWLWFHGNAGNISHRLENLKLLHDELGVSVFLFDYRGYGRSEGTPSEEGTYRDGEAALSHLRSREDVDPDRIVYFGRSLGAGIAVELAISHPPFALILESPVPSIPELARRHYPFLPVWPLLRTKYDSLAKIEKVATPLLVLHGDRDDVVPFGAGRKLFEAANEPKEFYTIRGAGHNDTYLVGGEEYFGVLRRFMENLGQ